MPDYKDILKHGWHPEKQGTSLKGQMVRFFMLWLAEVSKLTLSQKSLVGRGEDVGHH